MREPKKKKNKQNERHRMRMTAYCRLYPPPLEKGDCETESVSVAVWDLAGEDWLHLG